MGAHAAGSSVASLPGACCEQLRYPQPQGDQAPEPLGVLCPRAPTQLPSSSQAGMHLSSHSLEVFKGPWTGSQLPAPAQLSECHCPPSACFPHL